MKNILQSSSKICLLTVLPGITLSITALANEPAVAIRLSEPVERTAISETFGATYPEAASAITLRQLVDSANEHLNQQVLVNTRIAKVCQKKGCFFIAQDGDITMRVSFKDYGFFIPTDSSDKAVDLAGVLTSKQISEKQARHFAKDIGEEYSAIKTGQNYEFIASSVRITDD